MIKSLSHGLYFDWMERNRSYLTFGSVDTAKYDGNLVTFNTSSITGEITTVELISAAFGSPDDMKEISSIRYLKANIEFSTTRISLPDGAIPAILDRTGAEYDEDWGGYLIDCDVRNSDLIFEFRFRDVNITVNANHFILPAWGVLGYRYQFKGQDACSLQLGPMSSYSVATDLGYEAVLGTPFARHTYLVHDYGNKQLSFAPVKFNTTETNVLELDSRGVAPLFSEIAVPTTSAPTSTSGAATDTSSPMPTGESSSTTNTGAIAGGVVGGVAGLSGIAIIAFMLMKRRRRPLPPNENLPPPPPMMHNPLPSPPGPQAGYSHVPVYDPTKAYNDGRPVSELAGAEYGWGQQPPQGHPQFGTPYQETQIPYQENAVSYNYGGSQGNPAFAHELPSQHR
ncbi:Candidapepsin-3 [Dactylellina cionopaga]|nr:Candidapepsin-3 [Dactylellina cionopaga]